MLVAIFPVTLAADADAYLAWCTARNPDVGAPWYPVTFDRYNQRVVGYLGPGGLPFHVDEPEGGPAMRAMAVLQDGFDPINEE